MSPKVPVHNGISPINVCCSAEIKCVGSPGLMFSVEAVKSVVLTLAAFERRLAAREAVGA